MKKTFFSFAIATLMSVAMAACGNKGGNGNEVANDSTATEEAVTEEAPAVDENVTAFERYSAPKLGGAWEVRSQNDLSINYSQKNPAGDPALLFINVGEYGETLNSVIQFYAQNTVKKVENGERTEGGNTWRRFDVPEKNQTCYIMEETDGQHTIEVKTNMPDDDADVIAMLAGIKLK